MTTWRELIEICMTGGDSLNDIKAVKPADLDLDEEFYGGFGGDWYEEDGTTAGQPFVLWTEKFVYFSRQYDGAKSVGRIPRDPDYTFDPIHF